MIYKNKTLVLLLSIFFFSSVVACGCDNSSCEKIDEWVKIDEKELDGYDFGQDQNGKPILVPRYRNIVHCLKTSPYKK